MIKQVLFAATGLTLALASTHSFSHGSLETPVSRIYQCYQEGPSSLDSTACQAMAAESGVGFLYDWMSLSQNPNGDHQAFVADGLLCAGGNSAKSGLDLPRSDWVKTPINTGQNTFVFYATAPHATLYYRWYMTKQGWNQNQSLTWDSLELIAETGINEGRVTRHSANVNVPNDRSGYHVIYNVWQRSDSPEAFYSCADVVIGDDNSTSGNNTGSNSGADNSGSETDTSTGTDTGSNTGSNNTNDNNTTVTGDYPNFVVGTLYASGDRVLHNGQVYACEQPGWCSSQATFYYEPGVGLAWPSAWSLVGTAETNTDTDSSNTNSGSSGSDNSGSENTGSGSTDSENSNTGSGNTDSNNNDNSTDSGTGNGTDTNSGDDYAPAGYSLIGYIDGSPLLDAGVVVSLRLFDTNGSDYSTYTMEISNDGDDWLTPLANLVNKNTSVIQIGTYDEYGQLHVDNETQLLNVYSLDGTVDDFEIDLLLNQSTNTNGSTSSGNIEFEINENEGTTMAMFTGNLGTASSLLVLALIILRRQKSTKR